MSQPQLSDLVKQAKSEKAKERRTAYRRMAASRDPQVIPYLRRAYLQDEDDVVRDLAYDALADFKAIQQGQTIRRAVISESTLKKVIGVLAITLVLTLILNGVKLLSGNKEEAASPTAVAQTEPSNREALVTRMQERLSEASAFSTTLRSEITLYNTTGQVACNLDLPIPQALALAPVDQLTFRDLGIVGSKFDAALAHLDSAQLQWRHSCRLPSGPDVADVLGASQALDRADIQLEEVGNLLQTAIDDPAPTTAPTLAPDSMAGQPAAPTAEQSDQSPTDGAITAPAASPQPDSPQPTAAPTLTPTLVLTGPLPYPDLDYPVILRSLSQQVAVMGDLQNQYNSGMLDQWRLAQTSSEPSSTSGCALDPWPATFTPTADQQAQLNRGDAADPALVEAINLIQEGIAAATQARVLFERDCPTGSLALSADEGMQLAEAAYSRLSTARDILDTIRQRPASTP